MKHIVRALTALILAAALLCPAAAADAGPVLLLRPGEGSVQLALSGLGDRDVSSVQLSFTLPGSRPQAAFAPGGAGQYGTCRTEETEEGTRFTLYLDSLKNLNQAGLAYLGALELEGAFTAPGSAQLILLGHGLEGGGSVSVPVRTAGPEEAGFAVRAASAGHGTLRVQPDSARWGTAVTVTADPEDGYRLAQLNALCGGSQIALTKKGGGAYSFIMPAAAVEVRGVFTASEPLPFADVGETSWYYEAVRFAYEKELVSGVTDTSFSPNQSIDRGMIVTILHRMAGAPSAGDSGFADVEPGQYYAEAVAWAAANGVVTGYGNGRFGPRDPITREQMAMILWRYARLCGKDVSAQADLSGFADAGQISGYAAQALRWANAEGLVNGTGGGRLSPRGTATRAQAVQLLERFCRNILA